MWGKKLSTYWGPSTEFHDLTAYHENSFKKSLIEGVLTYRKTTTHILYPFAAISISFWKNDLMFWLENLQCSALIAAFQCLQVFWVPSQSFALCIVGFSRTETWQWHHSFYSVCKLCCNFPVYLFFFFYIVMSEGFTDRLSRVLELPSAVVLTSLFLYIQPVPLCMQLVHLPVWAKLPSTFCFQAHPQTSQ